MMEAVEKIAATVLYEGYLLWPYRRSAIKNQKRWNFGGVYPRAYSEKAKSGDPWEMRTECLVRGGDPSIAVKVRFLQSLERRVARRLPDGGFEFVEELQVGSERYLTWEEARERELVTGLIKLSGLVSPIQFALSIPAGQEEETLKTPDGQSPGALSRVWDSLEGTVEIRANLIQAELYKVTVRITNTTPWHGQDREQSLKQTFLSTHTLLEVEGGEFISLTDPPAELQAAAKGCLNLHTWPVPVGKAGETRYLLSSPIILPDYPQVAPESPGMLFDSTEVDQLLLLNILALTDDEKREIRATDPKAREILERSESLGMNDFMQLHGTIREFRTLRQEVDFPTLFETLETPVPESLIVQGTEIRKGSRVRLRPRPGPEIWDMALAGKIGFIESIEQDYDGRTHLAVTLEDDPGRDLGEAKLIGHRFFFSPDEVEPLIENDESGRKADG